MHTFLFEHAITSHVLYTYLSVPRDVYATIDKQARSEMAIFQQAGVHSDASYRPHTFARPVINFTCQNSHPENSSFECLAVQF